MSWKTFLSFFSIISTCFVKLTLLKENIRLHNTVGRYNFMNNGYDLNMYQIFDIESLQTFRALIVFVEEESLTN